MKQRRQRETLGETLRRVLQEAGPTAEAIFQAVIDRAKAGNKPARKAIQQAVLESIRDGNFKVVSTMLDEAGVKVKITLELGPEERRA